MSCNQGICYNIFSSEKRIQIHSLSGLFALFVINYIVTQRSKFLEASNYTQSQQQVIILIYGFLSLFMAHFIYIICSQFIQNKIMDNNKRKTIQKIQTTLQAIKISEDQQTICYDDLIYILSNKKIPIFKISLYLVKKYKEQIPKWQQLSSQQIYLDYLQLSKMLTQRHWVFHKFSGNIIKSKKQLIDKYEKQSGKSKQAINYRMKILNQSIIMCQGRMNSLKKQQQVAQEQKRYQQLNSQITYWKKKKKIVDDINLENSVLSSPQKKSSQHKKQVLEKVQEKIKEIKQMNEKAQNQKNSNYTVISSKQQLMRLSKIYYHYAKGNVRGHRLFTQLQSQLKKLHLDAYLKFIKDFQLNRVLNLDEISRIYRKIIPKQTTYMSFDQFVQSFQTFFVEECIKSQKQFKPRKFQQFMLRDVVQLEKIKQKLKIKITNTGSNYEFKPFTHTGKIKQDIVQDIIEKNQQKQYLKIPNKKNTINTQKTKMRTLQTSQPSIRLKNDTGFSYAKLFATKKKYGSNSNVRQNRKIQLQKLMMPEQYSQIGLPEDSKYQNNQSALDLKMLIGQDQQDQYLQKHLLPPLKKSNVLSNKIHF